MFRVGKALRRRVAISNHGHHGLVMTIGRDNAWKLNLLLLLAFTVGFLGFSSLFAKALFRIRSAVDILYLLPFIAFVMVWYLIVLRFSLWRAFGVEEIVVRDGRFRWNRTAGPWRRRFEAGVSDISDVEAKTPWHALSNRVEFTCKGRRYTVGDMLLRDEAVEVAGEIGRVAGLHNSSVG